MALFDVHSLLYVLNSALRYASKEQVEKWDVTISIDRYLQLGPIQKYLSN